MEVVVSLSQGRTAAAQCDFFTYKSVPVAFEPPCRNCCADVLMECKRRHVKEQRFILSAAGWVKLALDRATGHHFKIHLFKL